MGQQKPGRGAPAGSTTIDRTSKKAMRRFDSKECRKTLSTNAAVQLEEDAAAAAAGMNHAARKHAKRIAYYERKEHNRELARMVEQLHSEAALKEVARRKAAFAATSDGSVVTLTPEQVKERLIGRHGTEECVKALEAHCALVSCVHDARKTAQVRSLSRVEAWESIQRIKHDAVTASMPDPPTACASGCTVDWSALVPQEDVLGEKVIKGVKDGVYTEYDEGWAVEKGADIAVSAMHGLHYNCIPTPSRHVAVTAQFPSGFAVGSAPLDVVVIRSRVMSINVLGEVRRKAASLAEAEQQAFVQRVRKAVGLTATNADGGEDGAAVGGKKVGASGSGKEGGGADATVQDMTTVLKSQVCDACCGGILLRANQKRLGAFTVLRYVHRMARTNMLLPVLDELHMLSAYGTRIKEQSKRRWASIVPDTKAGTVTVKGVAGRTSDSVQEQQRGTTKKLREDQTYTIEFEVTVPFTYPIDAPTVTVKPLPRTNLPLKWVTAGQDRATLAMQRKHPDYRAEDHVSAVVGAMEAAKNAKERADKISKQHASKTTSLGSLATSLERQAERAAVINGASSRTSEKDGHVDDEDEENQASEANSDGIPKGKMVLCAVRYLIDDVLRAAPMLQCALCREWMFPQKPAEAQIFRKKAKAELIRCGHVYHAACLEKFMVEPPHDTKPCHVCGEEVHHQAYTARMSEIAREWSVAQASKGEQAVVEAFCAMSDEEDDDDTDFL